MAAAPDKLRQSIHDGGVLSLNGFGIAYNGSVVISDASFVLTDSKPLCLYGPMGSGKSTLLRAISSARYSIPSMRVWGECHIQHKPLSSNHHAELISQSARLMISSVQDNLLLAKLSASTLPPAARDRLFIKLVDECNIPWALAARHQAVTELSLARQRVLGIWRTALHHPPLIAIDEPTADLDGDDRQEVLAALRSANLWAPMIVATHNRQDAVDLGASLAIIDDGVARNVGQSREFSQEMAFAKLPMRDTARSRAAPVSLKYAAPPGFVWVLNKQLAGCRRPGLLGDEEQEVRALAALGIRTLIGLEEEKTVSTSLASKYGIRYLHFPIPDMDAPLIDEMELIMGHISSAVLAGEAVAIHCRAGLGRTGTVLAAALIEIEGIDAITAVERIRLREPLFVQSATQIDFLHHWAGLATENG